MAIYKVYASTDYVDEKISEIPEGFSGSWNDLEDKPFYETYSETEIVPETTVNIVGTPMSNFITYRSEQKVCSAELIEGETYFVEWDGTTYECVATNVDSDREMVIEGGVIIGNRTYMSVYSGGVLSEVPFLIDTEGYVCTERGEEEVSSHTIRVYQTVGTIVQLDEKYIPDTIARTADIPEVPVQSVNGKTGAVVLIANDIGAGTFAGEVIAKASAQTPATSLLRNSKLVASETTPSNNGEICWMYE